MTCRLGREYLSGVRRVVLQADSVDTATPIRAAASFGESHVSTLLWSFELPCVVANESMWVSCIDARTCPSSCGSDEERSSSPLVCCITSFTAEDTLSASEYVRWCYAGYTGRTAGTTMLENPERANAQFTKPRTSAYKDILMAKSLDLRRRAKPVQTISNISMFSARRQHCACRYRLWRESCMHMASAAPRPLIKRGR